MNFDESALRELRELMGSEWIAKGLQILRQQIEGAFTDEPELEHREELARRAHALVSQSGLLGFPELSHLCSVLEEAANGGQYTDVAFQRAKAAAVKADRLASEMLRTST